MSVRSGPEGVDRSSLLVPVVAREPGGVVALRDPGGRGGAPTGRAARDAAKALGVRQFNPLPRLRGRGYFGGVGSHEAEDTRIWMIR